MCSPVVMCVHINSCLLALGCCILYMCIGVCVCVHLTVSVSVCTFKPWTAVVKIIDFPQLISRKARCAVSHLIIMIETLA